MGKNRTARRPPLPDPEAVLSGRVRPEPFLIIDLIRAVNPTGAALPEEEARARYGLKNRLQSLLLRRFPEHVSIESEPGQPGLVLLAYRGRGACHARLQELDEDARAFAQRALDEGSAAETGAPGAAPKDENIAVHAPPLAIGGEALLEEGLRLGREYDYEGARACLREALSRSGGAARPARALLSLLVDELGLDGEALDLRAALCDEAAADPEVRARLAVAAARCGQEAEARALLGALRRPAAAQAWLLLSQAAEAAGELDTAEDDAQAARESDPAHPDVAALRERLARRRAEQRRPEEEAAEALLQAGALGAAAERARLVLRRHPGSSAARRVLRAVEAREHEARAQALLGEAERLQAEAPGHALERLAEALGTGVGGALRGRLLSLQGALSARLRAEEQARRVGGARALLLGDEPAAGLVAYQQLPIGDRAALRAGLAGGEAAAEAARLLGWLDEILAARRGAPERGAAAAALALREALRRVPLDPRGSLELLTAHARLLDPLPAAQQAQRQIRARLDEEERGAAQQRARALLAQAEQTRDPTAALAHLDQLDDRLLTEEEGARAAARRAELTVQRERARRQAQLNAALRRQDVNEARAIVRRMHAGADSEGARAECAIMEDLCELTIRSTFSQRSCDVPGPPGELADLPFDALVSGRGAEQWLTGDGRCLIVSEYLDPILLVALVDAETGVIASRLSLILPPTGALERVQVEAEGAWHHFACGALLCLSPPDLRISRWCPGEALRPPQPATAGPEPTSRGAQVVGGRYLWQSYFRDRGRADEARRPHRVVVTDLVHPGERRLYDGGLWHLAPSGFEQPVFTCAETGAIGAHAARGDLLKLVRAAPGIELVAVSAHLDERDMLMLCAERGLQATGPARGLRRLHLWATGASAELVAPGLPELVSAEGVGLICQPKAGRLVLRLHRATAAGPAEEAEIRIYGPPAPERAGEALLSERVRRAVPRRTVLVHDALGRHCLALCWAGEAAQLVPVGDEGPALQAPGAEILLTRDPSDVFRCAVDLDPPYHEELASFEQEALRSGRPAEQLRTLLGCARRRPGTAAVAAALLVAEAVGGAAMEAELARAMADADAASRLFVAHHYALRRSWEEADRWLAAVAPGAIADGRLRRHLRHLQVLAALWRGEAARARAALAGHEGDDEGPCRLRLLGELCGLEAGPPQGAEAAALRRLRTQVAEADELLARGEARAAIAVLDHPLLWRSRERQALARLVEALLAVEPRDEVEGWRFTRAVAILRRQGQLRPGKFLELPYPGRLWSGERLAALWQRAAEFLVARTREGNRHHKSLMEEQIALIGDEIARREAELREALGDSMESVLAAAPD